MRTHGFVCRVLLVALFVGCGKQQEPTATEPGTERAVKGRQPREQPADDFDTPKSSGRTTVTTHRQRAGEPDEEGWCLAESTEGGFSVKLPSLFNDYTLSWRTPKGDVVKLHDVGTKTASGTSYGVSAVAWPSDNGGTDFVDNFGKEHETGVRELRPVIHAGLKGTHLRTSNPDSASLARAFQNGKTRYILSVDYKGGPSLPPNAERDAITFFESFRLK